ncbi:MAG TPA: alpha/beta hydrolase [Nitrososphaeraceae archaeon]|nr:alpha/beta hydrolase [Nitrososphaeraceae archaeon]
MRDLPEKLIEGKEDIYLNWFYDWTYNQSAITSDAREEYIKQYSKPGAMRAGFEYYRTVFEDAEQNKEYAAKQKLNMPILTISGEAWLGNLTTISFQKVANNATGVTLPNTGHFIPEERPNFLTKQIFEFLK